MDVLSLTVNLTSHMDIVVVEFDRPSAAAPFDKNLHVMFHATRDTGEAYCKEHFPDVPVKIINQSRY